MRIIPLGDSAVVVELGRAADAKAHRRVRAAMALLSTVRPAAVTDLVPSYTSVTLHYDIDVLRRLVGEGELWPRLRTEISAILTGLPGFVAEHEAETPLVEVPVCYDDDFGPDLADVSKKSGLPVAEVVARHAGGEYRVMAIGFVPGFAYLGGLAPELATPRRAQPRLRVPAGSVGIAGQQTAVYPVQTPGGWNLIGRTPLRLFSPDRNPPTRLQLGDRVRFRAIARRDFEAWPAD